MKIYRRNKTFEVMSGYKSMGVFPSLETARDFIIANGDFPKQVRDWKNTAKYDIGYDHYLNTITGIDSKILEGLNEDFYNDSILDEYK